eukprot:CAMPEP_0204608212 /NCGR_PEP_ID=MMETSP0661-20131031/60180_1 /ASSEMBLY_ACC=CAM_ASM_000606 /TAXON_ID=109239 /ORGANISM="Alexandrium margalefi, Strain AMGDE01CS-322" /LENGTH=130 /DNA_ID=CAMNT_0051619705 /DNA_START=56 /DNA_END=444 /DNA_ORIENTATION=-
MPFSRTLARAPSAAAVAFSATTFVVSASSAAGSAAAAAGGGVCGGTCFCIRGCSAGSWRQGMEPSALNGRTSGLAACHSAFSTGASGRAAGAAPAWQEGAKRRRAVVRPRERLMLADMAARARWWAVGAG